jgi:hypothetical protein
MRPLVELAQIGGRQHDDRHNATNGTLRPHRSITAPRAFIVRIQCDGTYPRSTFVEASKSLWLAGDLGQCARGRLLWHNGRHVRRPMFDALDDPGDRPNEISQFVRLWLAALAASAVIAIWMINYSIANIGLWRALLANFVMFGVAIVLQLAIARRRSNIARWLLAVPFNLLVLFYDLAHLDEEMVRGVLLYVVLLRLGLMAAATWHLFTAPARAWFRDRQAAAE